MFVLGGCLERKDMQDPQMKGLAGHRQSMETLCLFFRHAHTVPILLMVFGNPANQLTYRICNFARFHVLWLYVVIVS